MKHVMHDLETLGTVPGCVILSIGAVVFDPLTGELGEEFYCVVNTASCEEKFLTVDADTMAWWSKQSPEARELLDLAATGGKSLTDALELFNRYLFRQATPKEIRLYGNGADFDNPILRVAYEAAGVKPGYAAYSGRCYRQLKNLHELFGPGFEAPKIQRHGVHHNALDDAKSQARHLMEFVATIREFTGHVGEK